MTPLAVRRAAALVALQGAVGVIAAAVFAVRGLAGADRHVVNGYGNAVWFAICGAALLGAGWALWNGRRWGRGLAVYAQMLLLPVSWYIGVGSHRWFYAIPVALLSMAILALLFSRPAVQWMSGGMSGGMSRDASSESSDPDTR